MGVVHWLCRSFPGFSILGWLLLSYWALGDRIPSWFHSSSTTAHGAHQHQGSRPLDHLTTAQILYITYSLLVHLLGCLSFPLRLLWSLWHIGDEVKSAKFEAAEEIPVLDSEGSEFEKSSQLSGSLSTRSLNMPEGSLSRVSTPRSLALEDSVDHVIHAIILPSYKEDIDTLRETLSVLASHHLAKSSYDVYLAMEHRDPDGETVATQLILIFSQSFRNISFTLHPGDISGEVAGKSSNVSWAARQLSHNYVDNDSRRRCVITVMDSDTHLSSSYFLLVTKHHRDCQPDAASTMYVMPIIFDRNSHIVNPLVRTADIFWCGAGLSGMYKGSPACIPTSVYSMAMTLASQVGGWDTGPESIGEDLHMYLKCYFASAGRFNTKIIYCPASQSNVCSDSKGWIGAVLSVRARYKQAMRHMWGSLDSGYAIEKSLEIFWQKNDEKLSSWLSAADDPADRVPRWVKDSNLTHFTPPNLYEDSRGPRPSFGRLNLIILFHRLFEAHFLPTHLTIALLSAIIYSACVPADATNPYLQWSFGFNGTLRLIGLILTVCYVYLYEGYHRICVRTREDEMKRVGLWERMPDGFSHRSWRRNLIDYSLMPVTGALFGTIPAMVAEICHFWTDRLVYTVSAKPLLKKVVEKGIALA